MQKTGAEGVFHGRNKHSRREGFPGKISASLIVKRRASGPFRQSTSNIPFDVGKITGLVYHRSLQPSSSPAV